MKYSNIKSLSINILEEKIIQVKDNLQKLKFANSISPIENPMKIKYSRKLIAMLKTAKNKNKKNENKN
jgi:large subunit ribosomal protein L29